MSGLKSSNVFARVNRQAGLRNPTYGSAWSGVGWVELAKPNKIDRLSLIEGKLEFVKSNKKIIVGFEVLQRFRPYKSQRRI
jgi:hypothetical protein